MCIRDSPPGEPGYVPRPGEGVPGYVPQFGEKREGGNAGSWQQVGAGGRQPLDQPDLVFVAL
eukprot:4925128-Prymnesium_polylepis.1